MKRAFFVIWFAVAASHLMGQTPVASPAGDKPNPAPFGSSLKKYENKDWRKEGDDNETIRVETALVINDVLVTAPDGSLITSLKKEDLIVKDDGEPQDIELFLSEASKPVPRAIVLIMGILNAFDWSNYERKVRAAKQIVDDLGPNDEMAIVANDLRLLTDFTNDKTRLKDALDVIAKKNDWASFTVFGTLMAVVNEKFKARSARPIIIVQGAVSEIFEVKTDDDSFWNSSPFAQQFVKRYLEFTDIENAVKRSNVSLYNVITTPQIFGRPRKEQLTTIKPLIRENSIFWYDRYLKFRLTQPPFIPGVHHISKERNVEEMQKRLPDKSILFFSEHQRAMTRLADISGGASYFVEKPEDADAVYKKLSQTIKSRYTIGYYPKTSGTRGKPRSISITVKDHPEYTVTTRTSYIP